MPFRRTSKSWQFVMMAAATMTVGLLIGWADIHTDIFVLPEIGTYVLASALLGWMRPRLLWLWPLMFAIILFAVHVWAIGHGYKPPFVEKDTSRALACLFAFFPCLLGGLAGGGMRVFTTHTEMP